MFRHSLMGVLSFLLLVSGHAIAVDNVLDGIEQLKNSTLFRQGEGTQTSPYLIDGKNNEIKANGDHCLQISNIKAHIVVRNYICSTKVNGLKIQNAENLRLENIQINGPVTAIPSSAGNNPGTMLFITGSRSVEIIKSNLSGGNLGLKVIEVEKLLLEDVSLMNMRGLGGESLGDSGGPGVGVSLINVADVELKTTSIQDILGGYGAAGTGKNEAAGSGGAAMGISLHGSIDSFKAEVLSITNIKGGAGAASLSALSKSENGGDGGNGYAILSDAQLEKIQFVDFTSQYVYGGAGGMPTKGAFATLSGGIGGEAKVIYLKHPVQSLELSGGNMSYIYGGAGATSWENYAKKGGLGRSGGDAIVISATTLVRVKVSGLKVDNIFAAAGAVGAMSLSSSAEGGDGGHGGQAIFFAADKVSELVDIRFTEVSNMKGAMGGMAAVGNAYWPNLSNFWPYGGDAGLVGLAGYAAVLELNVVGDIHLENNSWSKIVGAGGSAGSVGGNALYNGKGGDGGTGASAYGLRLQAGNKITLIDNTMAQIRGAGGGMGALGGSAGMGTSGKGGDGGNAFGICCESCDNVVNQENLWSGITAGGGGLGAGLMKVVNGSRGMSENIQLGSGCF
jgi:hypothetical protein